MATICGNALHCIEQLVRAGSSVPVDGTYISSLWTIAENILNANELCQNTQRFISVMKMIKLSCPKLTCPDMLIGDSEITNYPTLSELRSFVLDYTNSPLRLQDLCRTVIRNELRDNPYQSCKELLVPQKLKDFVMFENM